MPTPFFKKAVAAAKTFSIDFADQLASGVTISGGTISARVRRTEAAVNAILESTTLSQDGDLNTAAQFTLVANQGTAGTLYELKLLPTTSDGQTLDCTALLFIE